MSTPILVMTIAITIVTMTMIMTMRLIMRKRQQRVPCLLYLVSHLLRSFLFPVRLLAKSFLSLVARILHLHRLE